MSRAPDPSRAARVIERVCAGDQAAASELFPIVYDELHELAGRYLRAQRSGHTLQPTALVHEAFVRLAAADSLEVRGSAHYAAVCAKAMREILVDHARGKNAQKRGGGWERVTLSSPEADVAAGTADPIDVNALDAALTRLTELDPEQARLVELRFFGGMSLREIAEVLGVSHTTVQRDLRMAQAWLLKDMTGRAE